MFYFISYTSFANIIEFYCLTVLIENSYTYLYIKYVLNKN